jgi:uncharacterized protein
VRFRQTLDPAALDLDIGILSFAGPLKVEGVLRYLGPDLVLEMSVAGTKRFECSRCLEPFEKPFEQAVDLHYRTAGSDAIDALPELGEELRAENPIHALCRPECRGICPGCGVNLNREKCRCPRSGARPV